MYGLCNLSLIPCRKEPSDKSEMVSQLLFGEHFEVLDSKGNWDLVRLSYDGYECWIDRKQYLPIVNLKGLSDATTAITTDLVQLAEGPGQKMFPLLLGSSLPGCKDGKFRLGNEEFGFDGDVLFPFEKKKTENTERALSLIKTAYWYLNAPYLWGGRSPFGIDCSGFTQMVFKMNGTRLQRDAWQQARQGKALSFLEEAEAGDLAFFDNEDGKVIHVGILLPRSGNSNYIIHASGRVRIDKLDHNGIYNEELKKYSHRLRVIKRIS